jgi:uncharacterized linocin/CFP29 family protein
MGENQVGMDSLFNGVAHGDVARRLIANGMNVNALRTNATLKYDEWKEIDKRVAQAARTRLVGVQDLIARGLEYRLGNGLASTVLQSQNASDITAAELSIAGDKAGLKDRPNFETTYLPLPICHKDWQLSIRVLEASRRNGDGLDLTMAELAGRKVAEKIEDLLFNGTGSYTFGGGTIYGYTNEPSANTVSIGTHWNDSGATGATILAAVLDMKQASISDGHYGPWVLYVPTAYDAVLDDDFKANSDLTIRMRIKEIAGIEDVKCADALTADHVVLVEMQPETARMVTGLNLQTVEWDSQGGMLFDFKVMAIMVPQVRADQDGKSGIVVLS